MLKAYISGQARLAAVIDGESLLCLEDGRAETESRSRLEFEYLLADAGDLRVERCQNWSEVSHKLHVAVRDDNALALLLIILDGEALPEARRDAIPLVEEALGDPAVRNFLIRRLSVAPLPSSAGFVGSLTLARSANAGALVALLREIEDLQGSIERVVPAWEALTGDLFIMLPDRISLRRSLRDLGVFHSLAKNDVEAALAAVDDWPSDQRVKVRNLIQRWHLLARPAERQSGKITRLLKDLKKGNEAAEAELIPLVYDELRRIARRHVRKERTNHTLQTTALVNEAYIRMLGNEPPDWTSRAHFFATAATVMKRILVDYARTRQAAKRGAEPLCIPLDESIMAGPEYGAEQILAVNEALAKLAELDPRKARVVEFKIFAGLKMEEIAAVLGISDRTVKRDWEFAQTWLYSEITSPAKNSAVRMAHIPRKSRL